MPPGPPHFTDRLRERLPAADYGTLPKLARGLASMFRVTAAIRKSR